jgi:hypothetical protein
MQALNLTETQKDLLRWLVSKVRAGMINEEEVRFNLSQGGLSLDGYDEKDAPQVKATTLDALQDSGCLSFDKSRRPYICALTARAYEAVDSNFDAPNLFAVSQLIPLTETKHLDPELWERCKFSLSAGGDDPKAWNAAVRDATVVLEERLRRLGKTEAIDPSATGEKLVSLIFGGKNSVLLGKLDNNQLSAYRNLYAGMIAAFRNPYAHRFIDPSPEVGGAIIVFINLLLKTLDDIDWDTNEIEA